MCKFCSNSLNNSKINKFGLLTKILIISASGEIILIVSILTKLQKNIFLKVNLKYSPIRLFLRLESAGYILRFFPSVIDSAVLRMVFSVPIINPMSNY